MNSYYTKKLNKRGFTLIELLAVIVVLAILALIAVPIVLNIIKDARLSSKQRSIDAYGRAVEYQVQTYMINEKEDESLGPITWSKIEEMVEKEGYKGSRVACNVNEDRLREGIVEFTGCAVADTLEKARNDRSAGKFIKKSTDSDQNYIYSSTKSSDTSST